MLLVHRPSVEAATAAARMRSWRFMINPSETRVVRVPARNQSAARPRLKNSFATPVPAGRVQLRDYLLVRPVADDFPRLRPTDFGCPRRGVATSASLSPCTFSDSFSGMADGALIGCTCFVFLF